MPASFTSTKDTFLFKAGLMMVSKGQDRWDRQDCLQETWPRPALSVAA